MRWPFLWRRTHERIVAELEAEKQQLREGSVNAALERRRARLLERKPLKEIDRLWILEQ